MLWKYIPIFFSNEKEFRKYIVIVITCIIRVIIRIIKYHKQKFMNYFNWSSLLEFL